ncbi:Crp/Fnr family transcriptional regulator [Parapedobacter sp.]
MNNILLGHIRRYTSLSEAECSKLVDYFVYRHLQKKEWAMHANERCNFLYFVARGCMRGYFVDEAGVEKTTQLAIEGWWITDFQAFSQRRTTDCSYQAVEPCDVFCISEADYQRLLVAVPAMERYFRLMYEIGYGASLNRVKYLFAYSKKEIFLHFREQYPDFVNRVPQYILATFLGLTPEYVSKLRAERIS